MLDVEIARYKFILRDTRRYRYRGNVSNVNIFPSNVAGLDLKLMAGKLDLKSMHSPRAILGALHTIH